MIQKKNCILINEEDDAHFVFRLILIDRLAELMKHEIYTIYT